MKIVPFIVNNHNNTFTETKKIVFSVERKEKSMGPTFCVAYTKCVATLWHDRIYLNTRVEHLSRGLVS